MAATILSCWRLKFSALAAPRTLQPPLDGDRVAGAVGVERAAGDLVAGGGEVVQHVEGGELEVAAHRRRGVRAGGAEAGRLDRVRVGRGQLGQRLELPGVVGVAEHHVGLERHRRAHADGIRGGQVRQRLGLGGGVLEEVGAGAVVELDAAGGVGRDRGGVLGGAVGGDGGGLLQRGGAAGQADFAVLVQRVVVRDRDGALRRQQHGLQGFAERLVGREGEAGGLDLGGGLGQLGDSGGAGDVELGHAVVLGDARR